MARPAAGRAGRWVFASKAAPPGMDEGGAVTDVGVVGDDAVAPTTAAVASVVTDAGGTVVADTRESVLDADPDVVVAVGESSLLGLARSRPDVPLLPVAAGSGVRSVPGDRFPAAMSRLRSGDWTTATHPLLSVTVDGESAPALLDATAVTAEPADISEYTVATAEETVARFRADGIVVATPAGTGGYARAAGAPVVAPETDVLAVVPIAPFATSIDHWVVPATEVTVTVERDEAAVEILADDRSLAIATVGDPVRFTRSGEIRTVVVPEGRSPYVAGDAELEKL